MVSRKKHRGVWFQTLPLKDDRGNRIGDRIVARWLDPQSGLLKQKDMSALGITNEAQRSLWAVGKLKANKAIKARIARDGALPSIMSIERSQDTYQEMFANERTRAAKRPALEGIRKFLRDRGARTTGDVTAPLIKGWGDFVRRPANPHGTGTRNQHLLAVGAWLRWCLESGGLPRVNGDEIRAALKREKAPRDEIAVLQPQQLRQLLAACMAHDATERDPIAAFVLLVLLGGFRYAEAEGLDWAEIDFVEKAIRLGSGRTKTKTHRVITMTESPTGIELLRALQLRGGSKGRVFPRVDRQYAERARDRLVNHYSAPFWTWHMLRRSCGSLLVCAGVLGNGSPFLTARRLGHGLAIAEKHYLHAYTNLPKNATTIEQAGGFEREAAAIVRNIVVVAAPGAAAANG